ncbi:hypothetical protein N0V86_006724 [Didymella sp. IMI 355093]|nr:hypothetical protein N0V86_006724 [Didymella sp. IMI 355093]
MVKATIRRRKETAETTLAFDQQNTLDLRAAQMRVDQQQTVARILQLHQEYAERQHEQQFQQHLQQADQACLNAIIDNRAVYEPPPLQLKEQLNPNLFYPDFDALNSTEQSNSAFSYFDLGTVDFDLWVDNEFGGFDDLKLPEAGIPDSDAWADHGVFDVQADSMLPPPSTGTDMPSQPCTGVLSTDDMPLAHIEALTSYLTDPTDPITIGPRSLGIHPYAMDIDMVGSDSSVSLDYTTNTIPPFPQAQFEVSAKPARKPRKKLPIVDIDAYFADFDASEDILQQPTSSKHNLEGEALAKHLVHEIGLAARLVESQEPLLKTRSTSTFFKALKEMTDEERRGLITPWSPLSDWLTLFEIEYEDLLARYGIDTTISSIDKLEWQTKNKCKAEHVGLMKATKNDLANEGRILIQKNAKALLRTLVELTGQSDVHLVAVALKKKFREMKVPGYTGLFAKQVQLPVSE